MKTLSKLFNRIMVRINPYWNFAKRRATLIPFEKNEKKIPRHYLR